MAESTAAHPRFNVQAFWDRVAKGAGCWTWTGPLSRDGYGFTTHPGPGGSRRVHRIAYEILVAPIPRGMYIDHRCHNRACVNPEHLRLATQKQNMENRSPVAYKSAASGVRGVCRSGSGKPWRARVKHHGREILLGQFNTIAEAEAAVVAARIALFTHNDEDRRAVS